MKFVWWWMRERHIRPECEREERVGFVLAVRSGHAGDQVHDTSDAAAGTN